MNSGQSVVELLLRDHQKAERLLGELDSTSDSGLEEYFCRLREELVRHEVAEELIVYPAFRRNVDAGDEIANACIAEQRQAAAALADLEKADIARPSFRMRLEELRGAVLAHAKHEETAVFPVLARATASSELAELGERYEKALAAAPTHPHPHAPTTPPGNVVVGSVEALVDRVRDAMHAS